jgi:UV DNA damage repair endonuclease
MTIKRIGFACKWSEVTPKGVAAVPELNCSTTTVAWLKRQTREVAEQKLWDLMTHNIRSINNLVEKVGGLDNSLRMVRLGSDILPVYTESSWSYFWRKPDVQKYCEREFARVGQTARSSDVRLSFHPGQFTVLASDNPDIVERSIEEFEYHVDMVRWMGYGQKFQDFKVNVHIAGRQGHEGIRKVLGRLSPEARNTITIENEENKHGLDDCLAISDIVPIVLDIHHHWIKTGDYIQPKDDRTRRVLDSWRGVRPTLHYSVSRETDLVGHSLIDAPDMSVLLEQGYKKQKLRAHSDYYWNTAANQWALGFLDDFDIMCESKAKNLASLRLYSSIKQSS